MNDIVLQVGVKILVKNEAGEYLLLRRSREVYPEVTGCWDFPGGRIDPGTPLLENLKREVQEETGMVLSGTPKLVAAQDILPNGRHIVRLTYIGRADGEVVLDHKEHDEFQWHSLEEMRSRGEELDRYLRELIEAGVLK